MMEPFFYQHNKDQGEVSVKAPMWFALLLILLMIAVLSWTNRQSINDMLARLGEQDDKIAEINANLNKQSGKIAELSSELDLAIVEDFGEGDQAGAAGSDGTDGADGADGTNSCIASTCVSLQASSPGLQEAGSINIDGSVLAADFQGSAAGLTDLNASEITTGSLADGRLSSNVALLDRNAQTFIGTNIFKPSVNSTTAFQVQNAAGTSVLTVDTIGQAVQLNGFGPIFAPTLAAGANTGGTLRGDTTYYYTVTAIGSGGESLPSPQAAFAPTSFTPLSPPAAPTATVTATPGNPNGTYTYKVTFITDNGETLPSAASNSVSPTSDQVDLSFATGPAGTVQRRLWRTTDGGSTYFLVANIMDNTTTTYTDNLADASLGITQAPTTSYAFTNTNNITVSFASVPGATSYRVYRSTTPNGHGTYFNTATSPFTDSGGVGTVAEEPQEPAAVTISAGLAVANLANCQRLQTDANGTLLCGTGGELFLSRLEVWGHSLTDGSGASVQYVTDWGARLSAMLHAQTYNRGVGGSVASRDNSSPTPGGYATVLQDITSSTTSAPYLPRPGAAVVWYGANDIARNGDTIAFKQALRTIIARNQAAAVFEDDDGSMVFAAGGGPAWSTVNDTEVNSGASYKSAGGNGNTYTISVPSDFPGGVVDIGLIATGDGNGAVHSFTIDGEAAGSVDTRNQGATGYKTGMVKRFVNLEAGAHTIVGTISAYTGSTYVDYWQIEAAPSRLILVPKQYRPATYTIFTSAEFHPGDADITALNDDIDDVVAEFDGSVRTVDTEEVINKNPSYLIADNIHLNDLGHAKVAAAMYEALARVPITPQQLAYSSAAVNYSGNNIVFKNSQDSTTAFQIQPASSATPVFNVDTENARIGIGTAAPLYKLDVRSTSGASQIHISASDVDSGGYIASNIASALMLMGGASYDGANFVAKTANASMIVATVGAIGLYSDTGLTAGNTYTPTARLIVASSGNVGVNTSGPDRKLDVLDASNPQLRLTQADGSVYTDLQTTSSGYLSISPSGGNTGFGTTTPGYKLDVRVSTIPQIHIAATDVDSGGYLHSSAANNIFASGGSAWNGSAWVAKAAQSNLYAGSAGSATIYLDTALTIGNTFTPTARLTINTAGATFADDLAINGGDLTTNQTTFNLINTTATTLNIGAAATTLNLGANTGTTSVDNNLFVEDRIRLGAQTLTVADNGNGGTAATSTLTPTASYVKVVCNDANGCDITMGEGSATDGDTLVVVNTTANNANFTNTAGVSQLTASPFNVNQYDNITFLYVTDRWIETARSNNL